MSKNVRQLEPIDLWNNFANLNEVPRPSKKEEKVIAFIKKFGEDLGLPTIVDEAGNVIIKKPASKGMENKQTVVLQSHLDMVHQKNAGTNFDFNSEGIKMLVDDDWVKAEGTTLGADNGIGVASIMTILSSKEIIHPPIEALFTIDEETGMTGAMALKGGLLDASIMLNLDTEDDRELTIGCAGGIDVTGTGTYSEETTPAGFSTVRLTVNGLTGGHSGMDIHLGRGNANKIMNRILFSLSNSCGIRISEIDGGGLRNAIPRESFAIISLAADLEKQFKSDFGKLADSIKIEYATTDTGLKIGFEKATTSKKSMSVNFQNTLLKSIYATMNGIYRMSPDIKDLVQTSNNLARVLVKDGKYTIMCLTRSSVDSEKMDLAHALQSSFELLGAKVNFDGAYPGWAPRPNAGIVKVMSQLYTEMFKDQADVNACHAGLECGILGTNYPEMEMISFGPNIRGAHSPDEKVQVSSVNKYWKFLLETLKRIPEKTK